MTFEKAKKLLEKEVFYLIKFGGPSDIVNNPFSEHESPEICEAGKVVNSAGYGVGMHGEIFNERKARLKKEYEENAKTPVPGKEEGKEGNPALEESASLFNDALLDEQGRKIFDLEERLKKSESDYMDKVHLVCVRGREINKLNKVIHEKNMMIKNLILERGRVARLLAAEQTIHKIDLQATMSAENALIYKEKEYEKSLQEKDEVIDDLSRELARSKEREEELIATVNDYLKEIDELKKSRRGDIKTMKELLKKIEDAANKTVNTENTAAARYAKKAMSERMVIPNSRIVVFSSRSPRNNFLDELRKSFFED